MRGDDVPRRRPRDQRGIIPACAGSTDPSLDRLRVPGIGFIPACAGKTGWASPPRLTGRDHPRVRGEHAQPGRAARSPGPGIIPACAGSTLPDLRVYRQRRPGFRPLSKDSGISDSWRGRSWGRSFSMGGPESTVDSSRSPLSSAAFLPARALLQPLGEGCGDGGLSFGRGSNEALVVDGLPLMIIGLKGESLLVIRGIGREGPVLCSHTALLLATSLLGFVRTGRR